MQTSAEKVNHLDQQFFAASPDRKMLWASDRAVRENLQAFDRMSFDWKMRVFFEGEGNVNLTEEEWQDILSSMKNVKSQFSNGY